MVACCRRIECLLIDEHSRYALDITERVANGKASRQEQKLALAAATGAAFDASGPQIGVGGWLAAAQARAAEAVAAALVAEDPAAWTIAAKFQCGYLRDIFGNPFQPTKTNGQRLQKSNADGAASVVRRESLSQTSRPMVNACLHRRTNYLAITG